MALASTQLTAKIGDSHFDDASGAIETSTGVTTRPLNQSEPSNGDDCEVIFLESTVLTKENAIRLLQAMMLNIQQNDWPR